MLDRAIAVINGKGGTGKTSISTNLAGLFAAAEARVLLVDMDPQGNAGRDLGYVADGRTDHGAALFQAVTAGTPLVPLREVRPNLDVVPGGELVEDMAGALYARGSRRGQSVVGAVNDALARIADDYDLVFIDCPPGNRPLQQMALAAAHFVVIPTRADDASLDGLVQVSHLFASMRQEGNPGLELLGVVLFGIEKRATRIIERARAQIARDLGDPDLVFAADIRHVQGPAQDCRRLGKLVHEIEAQLPHDREMRLRLLRAARADGGGGKHRPDPESVAAAQALYTSAPGLAEDYQQLAEELTTRIQAAVQVPA
jgi:cellulose biosynthesis protein BcsQ